MSKEVLMNRKDVQNILKAVEQRDNKIYMLRDFCNERFVKEKLGSEYDCCVGCPLEDYCNIESIKPFTRLPDSILTFFCDIIEAYGKS